MGANAPALAQPPSAVARAGANVFDARHLPRGSPGVPIGWYKDFGFHGPPLEHGGARLEYVPILTWQGRNDSWLRRLLLAGWFRLGQIPHPVWMTLEDFRDSISLERLAEAIRRDPERLPPGTLFLVGIEPGYRPNGDDRSAEQIVADAAALRAMLDGLGRGDRLGLGGISTPRNEHTRTAYGGVSGLDFLERILSLPRGFAFDAFVVHPYPSDPAAPSAADSQRQIREFRRVLARHGLRDREVIVGEIGTPFSATPPEAAVRYAREMTHFLLEARDADLGMPSDDDRLVQRFCWMLLAPLHRAMPGFSDNPALDFERSALVDARGRVTAVGRAFREALEEARP